jgi:DNA-binding CsgD family transcriptional regulator
MGWVAAGKTEWEIGQLLGIAVSTVHFHVAKVKARLGTSRRTSAVALLVLHGLL